jgi:succinate dehydrogenase/fumarate reductase flavoprotein subunit
VRYFNGPGLAPLSHGSRLVNALGQAFLERSADGSLELNNYMDLFSAVQREYREGRGPVYIDTRPLSQETIEELERCFFTTERPTFQKFFAIRGWKIGKDLIEANLGEAVLCGGHGINGMKVNARAETNVEGLYAAGDAAANATSLMGAFALGRIAGREAVKLAKEVETSPLNQTEVAAEKERILSPLKRQEGIPPAIIERKIRLIVNEYVDNPKSELKLRTAQTRLAQLRADMECMKAADYHDAMKAMEVQMILDCADIVVAASLERKESRWGIYHYRVDYPQRDDKQWRKFVIVQRNASGSPKVLTQSIPEV